MDSTSMTCCRSGNSDIFERPLECLQAPVISAASSSCRLNKAAARLKRVLFNHQLLASAGFRALGPSYCACCLLLECISLTGPPSSDPKHQQQPPGMPMLMLHFIEFIPIPVTRRWSGTRAVILRRLDFIHPTETPLIGSSQALAAGMRMLRHQFLKSIFLFYYSLPPSL